MVEVVHVEPGGDPPAPEPAVAASEPVAGVANDSLTAGDSWMQAGVFADYSAARDLQRRLAELMPAPVVIQSLERAGRALHRVRIGPLRDAEQLEAVMAVLVLENIEDANLVRD